MNSTGPVSVALEQMPRLVVPQYDCGTDNNFSGMLQFFFTALLYFALIAIVVGWWLVRCGAWFVFDYPETVGAWLAYWRANKQNNVPGGWVRYWWANRRTCPPVRESEGAIT